MTHVESEARDFPVATNGDLNMLLDAAVTDFLRYCSVERQLSHHTLQAYAGDLADFRGFMLADTSLASITEASLTEYLTDMIDRRKLAIATVRRRFACLRAFVKRFVALDLAPDVFA